MLPVKKIGDLKEAIKIAIQKSIPFYAYHSPNADEFCFGAQITPLTPYKEGEEGFIIAPFNKKDLPLLFIKDEINISCSYFLQKLYDAANNPCHNIKSNIETSYEDYCRGAQELITDMKCGRYEKAVLSRVINYKADALTKAPVWFTDLSARYPEAFTFIVSVPGITVWMGATPELLLKNDGERLHTMALAATRFTGDQRPWSAKEETEQKIVTDYIKAQFIKVGITPEISQRTELLAGTIEHLCNNITAIDADPEQIKNLLSLMHPTPAVGGVPLIKAMAAIKKAENRSRRYYAGYLGYVKKNDIFSLFVNLRSMELFSNMVQLYVGGGLTAASEVASEWRETEYKAQILFDCIKEDE
ncbi:MAG: chorismate-binding protein [Bacteroidales bacterium]